MHIGGANLTDAPQGDIILSRYWNTEVDTRASALFHYYQVATGREGLLFGVSGDGGTNSAPNQLSQAKMLIEASGLVGIGTTTLHNTSTAVEGPRLQVAGSGVFKGGLYVEATTTTSSLNATSTLSVASTSADSEFAVVGLSVFGGDVAITGILTSRNPYRMHGGGELMGRDQQQHSNVFRCR